MPGRIHSHPGFSEVYHRPDGAIVIHGMRHSRRNHTQDAQRTAIFAPPKKGYSQAGNGEPVHIGRNKAIVGGEKKKVKQATLFRFRKAKK